MTSIRQKFIILSLSCILLCSLAMTVMGLWSFMQERSRSSDQIIALTCQQQANKLNQQLQDVKGSVDACAKIVNSRMRGIDITDDEQFSVALDDVERMVGSIATNTSSICTYYLRYENHPGEEPAGFFYTREARSLGLTKEPLTQIQAYDEDDVSRVGWYYQPKQAGEPLWMDPYFNGNIEVYMASYVSPLYHHGSFCGVLGMDINLDSIIATIRNMKPYESGVAFLTSDEGFIYYHPDLPEGTNIVDVAPELAPVVEQLSQQDSDSQASIFNYRTEGVSKKLACCRLRNGMTLMLTANTTDINAPVTDLARTFALIAVLVSCVAVLAVLRFSRRITQPLMQLTEVADRITKGDMDVELPPATNDEVGVLTKSLEVTVGSLREYVSGMRAKAYRDSLTMVRNKTAYDDAIAALEERLRQQDFPFALLMLDLNYLKLVNDTYGHDRGDEYLRTSCQMICHVFEHSPVFRIGGDEFMVILETQFGQRHELLEELDRRMAASQQESDPWKRVSLAKGMGVHEIGGANVEDVFKEADASMYEDKRRMKAGR